MAQLFQTFFLHTGEGRCTGSGAGRATSAGGAGAVCDKQIFNFMDELNGGSYNRVPNFAGTNCRLLWVCLLWVYILVMHPQCTTLALACLPAS